MSSTHATSYCSRCKVYRSVDLFSHPSRATPYKTCSSCRNYDRGRRNRANQRRRQIFGTSVSREAHSVVVNPVNDDAGMIDSGQIGALNYTNQNEQLSGDNVAFHENNDSERHTNITENAEIGVIRSEAHVQIDEVVGEEALADDEPSIILSHVDTRECINLMRLRESLPDDHDEIFENDQPVNVAPEVANNYDTHTEQLNQIPIG
ncbi:hypothetical protein FRX31_008092 [Thalictrum thalictroides]|uniref:Uncharacterized protein n=1 Tax=Thalictrum thalictroides TaxID=46969 RepID=A0A7J6WXZ2_THATH|nr:hypothetical protein FRX31_008092 [Thalictrum thalictroides]